MPQANLLFLSAYLPAPDSPQAGQRTAFRHLRWLAERYQIWFAGYRNESETDVSVEPLRALCREVAVFDVNGWTRMRGILTAPQLPLAVGARNGCALVRHLKTLVRATRFERIHCEWAQMARFLGFVPEAGEKWVSVHDLLHEAVGRRGGTIAGFFWSCEARRVKAWERASYRNADTVLVQSSRDAALLSALLPGGRPAIRTIPPHFERYAPRVRRAGGDGPCLLFWGAMRRAENAEAACWLAETLMPRIRKTLPGAKLVIAGSQPPERIKALRSGSVTVTGFVPDPQQLFDTAHVAVLPLFRGAGIKVKVLECLAAGLPVLTTAVGVEGIQASEADGVFVIQPDAAAYADALSRMWTEPSLLERSSVLAAAWTERQDRALHETLFSSGHCAEVPNRTKLTGVCSGS